MSRTPAVVLVDQLEILAIELGGSGSIETLIRRLSDQGATEHFREAQFLDAASTARTVLREQPGTDAASRAALILSTAEHARAELLESMGR